MELLTSGRIDRQENKIITIELSLSTCLKTKEAVFSLAAEIWDRQWKQQLSVQAFWRQRWKYFCHWWKNRCFICGTEAWSRGTGPLHSESPGDRWHYGKGSGTWVWIFRQSYGCQWQWTKIPRWTIRGHCTRDVSWRYYILTYIKHTLIMKPFKILSICFGSELFENSTRALSFYKHVELNIWKMKLLQFCEYWSIICLVKIYSQSSKQ